MTTKHGRPVAKLVQSQQRNPETIRQAIRDIEEIRNRSRLRGLKIKALVNKGRR